MRPAPSEQLINFKAYPNPVKAHTQVAYELELEDQAFEGGELRLYSIAGNLLESRGLKRAQGVEEFNLSHLAPGKYIFCIFTQR
ncbi:T9SS type A sorting domain-containing protein [Psychroflexus maritimus]|uniref:T9SS type A sorting domain-containing protein n=1 Tax=Psychroflexus maritimus TaxID=2714865 RepID=A0A967E5W0_9FLAO|nr:T9SS type A sorting domain-containing protein [Psychroflexus maritimus]NGZ89106.1 T9SS type A sorting domain-containing protein [Psychroflexus maritimus]